MHRCRLALIPLIMYCFKACPRNEERSQCATIPIKRRQIKTFYIHTWHVKHIDKLIDLPYQIQYVHVCQFEQVIVVWDFCNVQYQDSKAIPVDSYWLNLKGLKRRRYTKLLSSEKPNAFTRTCPEGSLIVPHAMLSDVIFSHRGRHNVELDTTTGCWKFENLTETVFFDEFTLSVSIQLISVSV